MHATRTRLTAGSVLVAMAASAFVAGSCGPIAQAAPGPEPAVAPAVTAVSPVLSASIDSSDIALKPQFFAETAQHAADAAAAGVAASVVNRALGFRTNKGGTAARNAQSAQDTAFDAPTS